MKQTAQLFKALSDETRLRILALLSQGELCVCDLMATLELPQSTVSRHLAYLRNADLVEDRRQGVWMYYRLSDDRNAFRQGLNTLVQQHFNELAQVQEDLKALRVYLQQKNSSCG